VQRTAHRGDAQTWTALLTDRFLSTSATGEFQRKADLMRDISLARRIDEPVSVEEASVRVHGTLAVANMRLRGQGNVDSWRTAILIKENGRWQEAAEITTPITGAARSSSPSTMTDHRP
jgi:hypothetical protein